VLEPAELAAGPGAEVSTRLSLPPYGSRLLVLTDEARPRLAPRAAATVRRPPAEAAALASSAAAIDLTGGWRVSFGAGSPSVAMEPLRSWTDDEATRFFSGLGTYEREVEVPAWALGPGLGMRLELGEGQLSIVVGNLAVNHMAGRALPDYRLLNLRYGQRFEAQDMDRIEPVPSGLLGPIRLVSFTARGAVGKTRP